MHCHGQISDVLAGAHQELSLHKCEVSYYVSIQIKGKKINLGGSNKAKNCQNVSQASLCFVLFFLKTILNLRKREQRTPFQCVRRWRPPVLSSAYGVEGLLFGRRGDAGVVPSELPSCMPERIQQGTE